MLTSTCKYVHIGGPTFASDTESTDMLTRPCKNVLVVGGPTFQQFAIDTEVTVMLTIRPCQHQE
ncbi:hypothetical protein BaRGS_00016801, partial [Batillaria attramentaria]